MYQKSSYLLRQVYALICGTCLAAACKPVMAATLCVSSGGTGGCPSTINAAVNAASVGDTIQIGSGTFTEGVIITKSLSLIGAGIGATIIDATGQPNGIFINGTAASPSTGVGAVVLSGLTIENANFEGILVASATNVT